MKASRSFLALFLGAVIMFLAASIASAQVNSGDVITQDNSSKVANLVSPGNYTLVRQGMIMKITPATRLTWPPPYTAATEKYSAQVRLSPGGDLSNYKAGLPFPLVDVNDPQAADKIVWNFVFRPLYTDDLDVRNAEIVTHRLGHSDPGEVMTFGHLGFYKRIGRTEVAPTPIDPDIYHDGVAFRAGIFPILEPAELRGAGIIRQGSVLPGVEDYAWEYSAETRRLRRLPASELSDAFGVSKAGGSGYGGSGQGAATYFSTVDPDSAFGFAAKPADYNYRLLGERQMLASVDAANSPEVPCARDGGRTICPENWQMRSVYVIEATAKPRFRLASSVLIPRRVLYIDSEGWFVTASDLFNQEGELWKTIATFHAYRDRPILDASVSIWPFKRIFMTAMIDEDVTTGVSTTVYTPPLSGNDESWYINSGTVDSAFFTPAHLEQGH
jgi:hypothetical protein